MKKSMKGFTLIELVVVITILGILAAFAIPRFASLETEARAAAIDGLGGSVRAASALAHAKSLASGAAAAASISMEGQTVTMANFYPTADDAGIFAALQDSTGFGHAGGVFTKTGATTPANCAVTYSAAGAGGSPSVAVDTSGC